MIDRFGEEVDLLKDFDEYMNSEAGAFVLQHLTFQQKKTNFVKVLVTCISTGCSSPGFLLDSC